MSENSGKYLRFDNSSTINVKGTGGSNTVFIVHIVGTNENGASEVVLESNKFPGHYFAKNGSGEIISTQSINDAARLIFRTQ